MDKILEKNMEEYKNSLKTQTVMQAGGALILITVNVLSFTGVISPSSPDGIWKAVWAGFIGGASAAALILLAAGIFMNLRAMKNDAALKKMYVKENDERTLEICYRSAHASYWPDALGLLLAGVVSGYFNPVVSITCIACLLYICVVRIILKFVYGRKL